MRSLMVDLGVVFVILAAVMMAKAETVPDHVYLNDKIENEAIDLTYDEVANFFQISTAWQYECVEDLNFSVKNEPETSKVFAEYLQPVSHQGSLRFIYLPLKFGFNIQVEKRLRNQRPQSKNVENFMADVECGGLNGSALEASKPNQIPTDLSAVKTTTSLSKLENRTAVQDHESAGANTSATSALLPARSKNCGRFTFAQNKEIRLNVNEDDYFPEGSQSEKWELYVLPKVDSEGKLSRSLLARFHLEYSAISKNWLGNRSGSISYVKNFICALEQKDADTLENNKHQASTLAPNLERHDLSDRSIKAHTQH